VKPAGVDPAKDADMVKTVAIAGLGAIGLPLARALDTGVTDCG